VLENVPPEAGLQKRATFSTLNVGLAGTGKPARATCVASSGTNRSAIHYASAATLEGCVFVCNVERSRRRRRGRRVQSGLKEEKIRSTHYTIHSQLGKNKIEGLRVYMRQIKRNRS
jgi:hypothetical protein